MWRGRAAPVWGAQTSSPAGPGILGALGCLQTYGWTRGIGCQGPGLLATLCPAGQTPKSVPAGGAKGREVEGGTPPPSPPHQPLGCLIYQHPLCLRKRP